MPSYRRHVARHPQARSRALLAVRRHAWQTGPVPARARLLAQVVPIQVPMPDALDECVCTHPRYKHNSKSLCVALPGVLGCGCLGFAKEWTP